MVLVWPSVVLVWPRHMQEERGTEAVVVVLVVVTMVVAVI